MKRGSTGSSTRCRREPSDLLFIAPNWLGDAVMATPLVRSLEERYPEASVTIAARRYVAAVFEGGGGRRRALVFPGDGVLSRAAAVRSARPPGGFDACLVGPPSFAAALVAVASSSRRRIGYAGQWRSTLLTDALPETLYRGGHLSGSYLGLLGRLAGGTPGEIPLPVVEPPALWRETVVRICGERPYCVLAPGATYGSAKAWPRTRYAELGRSVAAELGVSIFVAGGGAERESAGLLAAEAGARSLAGELSLADLIAVLRGASVVVGNDSGPVHVAAALGRPTVAIFGPTSVEWTAPRGRAVRIVRSDVACAPCFRRECPLGTVECLERVSVDDARRAVLALAEGE